LIYDNNHIIIEGHTRLAFSEDVAGRFLAYGWNVERVSNANDLDLPRQAFDHFIKTTALPRLPLRRKKASISTSVMNRFQ
jgi:transketolase